MAAAVAAEAERTKQGFKEAEARKPKKSPEGGIWREKKGIKNEMVKKKVRFRLSPPRIGPKFSILLPFPHPILFKESAVACVSLRQKEKENKKIFT
jgi:ribosomal protein L32E